MNSIKKSDVFITKKISGVDKTVCTAEQKIACNYAEMWEEAAKSINAADLSQVAKGDAAASVYNKVFADIIRNGIDKRYNIDVIMTSFRNGFLKWAKIPFSERFDYEKIGNVFEFPYAIK